MPFFIPENLIELEYYKTENSDEITDENAELYADERDFAFFCTHFNYSRADYNALTPVEKAFILKAYENKVVEETTLIRNAVLNALVNSMRKKEKRFIELWEKKCEKADPETIEENIQIVNQASQNSNVNWIEKIYKGGRF